MRFWSDPDGREFGVRVTNQLIGRHAGLTITTEAEQMATANIAPTDGHYHIGKGRFRIKAGDVLPDGAEFVPEFRAEFRPSSGPEIASILGFEPGVDDGHESFEIDIVAAYEAYRADGRAGGDEDQFAFQDAVLGAFGISAGDVVMTGEVNDTPTEPEGGDGAPPEVDTVNDEKKPDEAVPKAAPKPEERAKPAPANRAKKAAPENR